MKKIESGVQIVASNIVCDANVTITLVAQGTSNVILNLFHTSVCPPTEHMIEMAEMQKQSSGKECGLYAIAVDTNTLSGINTHNI